MPAWTEGERNPLWIHSVRFPDEVRRQISRYAGLVLPVLIEGEEGTGRDEVARALHDLGPRRDSPFLHLSCLHLTTEKFLQGLAPWGKNPGPAGKATFTLYLEEVSFLDVQMQTLLLDFINQRRVSWPGLETAAWDVYFLSSSGFPLSGRTAEKIFRGDLLENLSLLSIALKPLRERRAEIPGMAVEILRERESEDIQRKKFSREALQVLQQHDWPGNLPELQSLVLRSAALCQRDLLLPEDLLFRSSAAPARPADPSAEKELSWLDVTLPTLAHEIKNPLVAISTFAHLLPEKIEDPEFRQEFSRLVNQDVRRINLLLENLLEFTQLSAPRPAPHDLNFLLGEILHDQQSVVEKAGGEITVERGEGLPLVWFDEAQLNFILRNLLENALSKTEGKGPLRLVTGLSRDEQNLGEGRWVNLEASYSGQEGMMGSIQRSVGLGADPDFQNLSLALLLVRQLMTRNRGRMKVVQEGDAGTEVQLQFPVSE